LRIPRIIAPTSGGALSAIGVVSADVVKDQSRTVMIEVKPGIAKELDCTFKEMEQAARAALRKEGFAESSQHHERSLAVRYRGQSFELEISQTKGDVARSFHRAHLGRYGYAQSNAVEIVSTRLRSLGLVKKLAQKRVSASREKTFARSSDYTMTYFESKKVRTGIYRREEFLAGTKLRTPCIVTEYSATTLIPSGARASVDGYRNLIIEATA
jgi:N-methylhydantoinase A